MTKLFNLHTNRRQFCTGLLGAAASSLLPNSLLAAPVAQSIKSSENTHLTLAMQSIHTGEKGVFDIVVNGAWVEEELARVNHLLRDHRSGDVEAMDRHTLMQLVNIAALLDAKGKQFNIISGYRSPKTNAKLAAKNGGVATKSLHMQGKAIDIAMPGVSLNHVHKAALSLKAGGVGKYTQSGFVHLDSGRVRQWGS